MLTNPADLVLGLPRRPRRQLAPAAKGITQRWPTKLEPDRPPERPGPADLSSRPVRDEARKAAVWLGMALAIVGVIVLAQPILLIIAGFVFSVVLDGGARLLGRFLPIGRGWRLASSR